MTAIKRYLVMAATLIAIAAFSIVGLANDCESEGNWSAVRACSEERQMAELESVYKDTLAFVRNDNPEAADLLVKAQKDWLTFAASSCDFMVASRLPGSNDLRLGCWQQFIEARKVVLASYRRNHGKVPDNLARP